MIPKKIHQIWVQGEGDLPERYLNYSNLWKEKHPNYEYKLWDDYSLTSFINDFYPQYISNYLSSNMTNKSNIGRYLIMHKIGGIYVDTDSYPLKPIDKFLETEYDISITRRKTGGNTAYNAAIAIAKPNISFWIDIMEFAINRNDLMQLPVEPFGIITLGKYINKLIEENLANNLLILDPIHFNLKVDISNDEQYVVHTYDRTWHVDMPPKLL
jgi:mannosyltransferase OCH1-like enzyme